MKAVKHDKRPSVPKTPTDKVKTVKMKTKWSSKKVKHKNPVKLSTKVKFPCKTCNIVLSSEKYYLRHVRTRHPSDLRSYKCDFDGKEFRLKNCLRIHMERHRTSEIWTCDVCQRSYVCKITFQRHLKTVRVLFDDQSSI